jgi:PPPDE putative peptidase domain
MSQYLRCLAIVAAIFVSVLASGIAKAEVMITFYSHELGQNFPHAFVKLTGTLDSSGEVIDTNYGFTARSTSPAILLGSVTGIMETKSAKYVRNSKPHFSMRLSDADYARVMEMVNAWRNIPGKSYNLGKRNCVHFTMEMAAMLGLSINRQSKFFKKPTSFMIELLQLNPTLKL